MEAWQWLVLVVFLIMLFTACLWGIQTRRRKGGVIAVKGRSGRRGSSQ